jgi:hypothetical protein
MLLALASVVFVFYCLTFETSPFVASYDSQGHGGGIRPRLHTGDYRESKVKVKDMLRPMVSRRSVLVSSTHLGLTIRFLLLSDSCRFVQFGRCLWRKNGSAVYNAVILGSEFRATRNHILLSQIRDSRNLEGQVPVFIAPGTGWPSLPPLSRMKVKVKVTLQLTVGQSVSLDVEPHL